MPDRTAAQKKNFIKVISELNERKNNGENNLQLKFINGNPQIKERKVSKNSPTKTSQVLNPAN